VLLKLDNVLIAPFPLMLAYCNPEQLIKAFPKFVALNPAGKVKLLSETQLLKVFEKLYELNEETEAGILTLSNL